MVDKRAGEGATSASGPYLHALVDLDPSVVVVVQLLVDLVQGLQAEAVGVAYAWRPHRQTRVCQGGGGRRLKVKGQTKVKVS